MVCNTSGPEHVMPSPPIHAWRVAARPFAGAQSAGAVPRKAFVDDPQKSQVEVTYDTLVRAVWALNKVRYTIAAMRNIGRKNMWHMGLQVILSRAVPLLRAAPSKRASKDSEVVILGASQAKFVVNKLTPALRHRLETWVHFGMALSMCKPPRTGGEWKEEVARLSAVMRGLSPDKPPVAGASGGYLGLWLARAYLMYTMRRAGVPKLCVKDVTVGDFAAVFPDQKKGLIQMAGSPQRKVSDIFRECAFVGPPETFAMWACLFLDCAVESVTTGWLQENSSRLRDMVVEYTKKHGFPPHPGVLIEEVTKTCKRSKR